MENYVSLVTKYLNQAKLQYQSVHQADVQLWPFFVIDSVSVDTLVELKDQDDWSMRNWMKRNTYSPVNRIRQEDELHTHNADTISIFNAEILKNPDMLKHSLIHRCVRVNKCSPPSKQGLINTSKFFTYSMTWADSATTMCHLNVMMLFIS